MKLYQWIRLRKDDVPESVFEAASRLAPQGLKTSAWGQEFKYECFCEDEVRNAIAKEILRICNAGGLVRSRKGKPGTYGHEIERIYEEADLSSAEILLLTRQSEIQLENKRDRLGRLLLNAANARKGPRIGRIHPNHLIVDDEVRKAIDACRFSGFDFKEVALDNTCADFGGMCFWEVKSRVTLPTMSNSHLFFHPGRHAAEPFSGDYSRIIGITDPPYRNAEPHYRRGDLAHLGTFDIANTFENYTEPHPAVIVSQRFCRFCLKNHIPLNVQPVRIDD